MAHGYPDFEGDKSGLYPKPEWAAKEGIDKNFYATRAAATFGQGTIGSTYLVPTGKTLYICGLSFRVNANLVASADLNQIGNAYLMDLTTTTVLAIIGGNGGGSAIFSKPHVVPADHTLVYSVVCEANHACDIDVAAWGYEI